MHDKGFDGNISFEVEQNFVRVSTAESGQLFPHIRRE